MAVSVYLTSNEKTLNDNDISNIENEIIKAVETKFGAELRK